MPPGTHPSWILRQELRSDANLLQQRFHVPVDGFLRRFRIRLGRVKVTPSLEHKGQGCDVLLRNKEEEGEEKENVVNPTVIDFES